MKNGRRHDLGRYNIEISWKGMRNNSLSGSKE